MNTMYAEDSLTQNHSLLHDLQRDYDYTHGLQPEAYDTLSTADQMREAVPYVSSDSDMLSGVAEWFASWPWVVWVVLILLVISALAIYVLRHWSGKTKRNKKAQHAMLDDIYVTDDYEHAIGRAWSDNQWNEVVRLTYLRTLRTLHDAHRIEWQPYKAFMAYVAECQKEEMSLLTRTFLYVRFGHYDATEEQCRKCAEWSDIIIKGADNEQE